MVTHFWVITGGTVDIEWMKNIRRTMFSSDEKHYVIAADKGLLYAKEAGYPVDYILGDFDSLPEGILDSYKESGAKIRTFPPEKDYTDTHLALSWAMEEGADKVSIIGGFGSRFDHSFANVGLLSMLLLNGIEGELLDPNNRVFMADNIHSGKVSFGQGKEKEYISLIPYTESVTGVTLKGFKYPLTNATLTQGVSLGISNELTGEEGSLTMKEGILLISVSKDE